jgi:hypothetical protein
VRVLRATDIHTPESGSPEKKPESLRKYYDMQSPARKKDNKQNSIIEKAERNSTNASEYSTRRTNDKK